MAAIPTVEQVTALPEYHRQVIPPEFVDANGHMNIRWYLAVHDEAYWTHLDALAMGDDYIERRRLGFFDLEHHLRYLREVHVGDEVSVHCRLLDRSDKVLHIMSFIVNRTNGQVANILELVTAHADLDLRRVVPMDAPAAAEYDRVLATDQARDWEAPVCGVLGVRAR